MRKGFTFPVSLETFLVALVIVLVGTIANELLEATQPAILLFSIAIAIPMLIVAGFIRKVEMANDKRSKS
jgi:low affinity Fe/Cu permease